MTDERTAEQKAADDGLREAVAQVATAYADGVKAGWLPTEYLLIYTTQGWDDMGDQCTAVGVAIDGESTPVHRLLGLAEYAAARYRNLASGYRDE